MQSESIIRGQDIDLERLTNDHIFELESIAFDARSWQHLPFNITNKQSFKTFIPEQLQKNLNA